MQTNTAEQHCRGEAISLAIRRQIDWKRLSSSRACLTENSWHHQLKTIPFLKCCCFFSFSFLVNLIQHLFWNITQSINSLNVAKNNITLITDESHLYKCIHTFTVCNISASKSDQLVNFRGGSLTFNISISFRNNNSNTSHHSVQINQAVLPMDAPRNMTEYNMMKCRRNISTNFISPAVEPRNLWGTFQEAAAAFSQMLRHPGFQRWKAAWQTSHRFWKSIWHRREWLYIHKYTVWTPYS